MPSSAGRSTATRAGSLPETRLANALASTRTPSSGASTSVPLSANWRKPTLAPAGQPAQA